MAYLLRYNGTGGVTAPTLGNIITGAPKIKIVIKKFRFALGNASVFWQGGAAFSLRELVFRRNGTGWDVFCGNTATIIATTAVLTAAFGNAELACDEFAFEIEGTVCRLYKDGVVVHSATIGRSGGRLNNALFYIGCQPVNDTAGNTAISTPAPNGSEYGDISIYINDVLTRQYVMPGTGSIIPDTANSQTASQNGTWPGDDAEWISTGVTQHQSTGGTATQAATSTADITASNRQQKATAGSAEQSATATADTSPLNGQHQNTTGNAAQSATGTADSTATNSQHKNSVGSAGQVFSAEAGTAPLNNQHRQSAGQLVSVAGFIADTSWVNTVYLGEVQHRATSGSASQSARATADTSALNSQHRQTSGTSAQAATGNADTTASNNQHRQSAGQLLSVAGFIADTSWVNTVDLGNIQHRGTSGSATQEATAAATATAINSQHRQSAGRATAECKATASTSRVNTILQKAVYVRRIGSQSITKKIYHTASRHKIELKTQRGGGYMQELNFKQGASALLQIEHTIDGEPVSGISEAKYELYGRTGQVLVTKSLGEGIEFSAGLIEIQLTEGDTEDLIQSYNHQCVAKDLAGLTFFPLNGQITFGATKPRL